MKRILVPTDFSNAADNAAVYAAQLSKKTKAEVVLLHVYHIPPSDPVVPTMAFSPSDLQELSDNSLKEKVSELHKKTGITAKYESRLGFAVDEILEQEEQYDLIVMGMRGAGPISEAFFGSISTDTLRKTKKPVIIIPEKAQYKDPKNIVFACDYDANTNIKSLEYLKEVASKFKSEISIVNVVQDSSILSPEEATAGLKLEHALSDIKHSYFFPENDNLVEGINDFAHVHDADLIAIIPHRHNLIERLFRRSTSKKIAFHTDLPLLALPDIHKSVPLYTM